MERSSPERTNPIHPAFFIIIMLLALLNVVLIGSGIFDLSPLEAHYWEWSRRLDLSYYSKPPMVAYIIALFTSIFGDNEIGVRTGAVVLSSLTAVIFLLLCKEIKLTPRATTYAFLFLILSPMFFGGSILMTTDVPLLFFWVLALYSLARALREDGFPWWAMTGIAIGFGMISKYTMFFFIPCMILYLLITGRLIGILKNHFFWLSVLIMILLFSPVLYWNYMHDWVSFKHTAGLATRGKGVFTLSTKYFFEFIGSQIGLVSPLIFFMVFAAWIKGFINLIRKRVDEDAFLISFSLPVFLFFCLLSLHGKTQGNWPAPCYITAYIYIAMLVEKGMFFDYKKDRTLAHSALVVASAVIIFAYGISIASEYVNLGISPKLNISNRLKGWKVLSQKVSEVIDEMGDEPLFIFSDDYNISSELAFYIDSHPVTYCVNLGKRMNQYDLWEDFSGLKGWNAIYVTRGDKMLPEPLKVLFDGCSRELFEVRRAGASIGVYSIFKCYNFHGGKPHIDKITY
ncbi:MAG: glycosyltransferase family 39 protein [Candidatus Aenigmatarchaeota archaeon]